MSSDVSLWPFGGSRCRIDLEPALEVEALVQATVDRRALQPERNHAAQGGEDQDDQHEMGTPGRQAGNRLAGFLLRVRARLRLRLVGSASTSTSSGHGGDRAAVERDDDARRDLDSRVVSSIVAHPAVHAAGGDDLVADGERVLHRHVRLAACAGAGITMNTQKRPSSTIKIRNPFTSSLSIDRRACRPRTRRARSQRGRRGSARSGSVDCGARAGATRAARSG